MLGIWLFAGAVSVAAQERATADSLEHFFKSSGYAYKREGKDSDVFGIYRDSKRFFFATNGDILIGGIVIAKKGAFKTSPEALTKFLRASSDYDYVKLLIDEDGDLDLRFDATWRILDQKEFNALLKQLFAADGSIRTDIQPYLVN